MPVHRAVAHATLAIGLLLAVLVIESPRMPVASVEGADARVVSRLAFAGTADERLAASSPALDLRLLRAIDEALLRRTPPPVIFRPTEPMVAARGSTPLSRQVPPPEVTAHGAVLLDERSMAVLYDKNAYERRAPASLTKIVTAAIAVQHRDLDRVVVNTIDAFDMPGSSLMGLRPDDEFTMRDLLYGMMLRSGNDAARTIARELAPSEADFVQQMNGLVTRLGLHDTHFIDPHGLGGTRHYSTPYDLAILARYGMQFPEFSTIVNAREWTAEGSRTIEMENLNPFMNLYEGADGMKTGFTEDAGPTFIGSAVRNGHRVYVVLLNSADRWGDAAALLDWAFEGHTWQHEEALVTMPGMPAPTPSEPLPGTAEAGAPDDGIASATRAIGPQGATRPIATWTLSP